jgi:hypothetical protein
MRLISFFALAFVIALGAARAQVGQILPSGSLSSITGCAASAALAARMDGGQNATAVTTLICGMVNDGTYAKLDGLYVFATNSEANAQLNWAQNAFNLTKNGTITFAANNGYTGDGVTGYLATGFNSSTAGGQTALNAASMAMCMNTAEAAASGVYQMGAYDGTNNTLLQAHSTSLFGAFVNSLNTQFANYNITNNAAALTIVRTTSTNVRGYKNIAILGNATKNSSALPNAENFILAGNFSGSAGGFSNKQFAWAYFGGLLSDAQEAALYNRLHTYLFAVGANTAC